MNQRKRWQQTTLWLAVVGAIMSLVMFSPMAEAKSSKRVKGSKGVPSKVAKAPVCDIQAHPKITKVSPDPVKPGQRITIKGKNFGRKVCFKKVSFGRYKAKSFKYVNDTTLEARVPGLKPGLRSVNILTAGGTSEYVVLVEKGKSKKSKKTRKSRTSRKSRRK